MTLILGLLAMATLSPDGATPQPATTQAQVPQDAELVQKARAFLTLVDLFATQAILPSLKQAFDATSAEIGFAVNACTIGMAIAGAGMALFSSRIDRRFGVLLSLALLSVPTALLAFTSDLAVFTALPRLGAALARIGLGRLPEETAPPGALAALSLPALAAARSA